MYNLLRFTPSILELADRSTVKPVGALDDITVTVASWEYLVDFLVLQTKDPTKEHLVILGRPWLAIANAFIGCREGVLTISNGTSVQNLIIYPLAQPVTENMLWLEIPYEDENIEQPLLSISQSRRLEDQTEDDILDQFIFATTSVYFPRSFYEFDYFFIEDFQEHYDSSAMSSFVVLFIDKKVESFTIPIEIVVKKSLIINARPIGPISPCILQAKSGAFSWTYTSMKRIHLDTCIHHIYT